MGEGGCRIRIVVRVALCICWALAEPALAARLTVMVTDRNGRPVHDMVVVATPVQGTVEPPAGTPPEAVVDQRGREFHPWVQVVRTGTRVLFDNHDDITHQVYSFSPAKRFSFRIHAGEKRGPLDFDAPGVVVLGCNIHDWMVAYVYITDSPYFARSDNAGLAHIDNLSAGRWKLQFWHPGLADAAPYSRAVQVAPDGEVTIRIRLREPLSVTGPQPPQETGYP